MQKAYLNLIKYALDKGCAIWFDDGMEMYRCNGYQEAKDAVESVDEGVLVFGLPTKGYPENGKKPWTKCGWAQVSNDYGFEPEETVIDFGVNDFMEGWDKQYSPQYL